eukprot:PITA_35958
MSLLDGHSSYNQILVHEKDQDKTVFTTPWETFQYAKIPFGLKNVGATFQRAMDIVFTNEKDVFLVFYLDDLRIFSDSDDKHLHHLRIVFQKCREFGISLNPKKSIFAMEEGKLLAHIISKYGIRIDPSRVEAIHQIYFPCNKKEIQGFNDVLMQIDLEGRRGKWISAMLEHDLEIKPTKLIKGQSLVKLMAESNLHALDINLIAAMSDDEDGGTLIQQWGLDFIGEIHPTSLAQHIWILKTTDYFTKWIEAILTRQSMNMVIIQFLESNILSCFGFPHKIITDNETTFKSKKMVEFCNKYNITLGHSMTYYPHSNGLAESSNKSLVNIIKKMLEANKKIWHRNLVNALWTDRVRNKKSIGMSPFELVYGTDTVFHTSLSVPVMRLLQEADSEEDDIQRHINQMIHLQQTREEVSQNNFWLQEKIKKIYDCKTKVEKFQLEDVVLQWDARNEEKGKQGKFDNLWKGRYKILAYRGQNAFLLKERDGQECLGGPVNGKLLKHYYF